MFYGDANPTNHNRESHFFSSHFSAIVNRKKINTFAQQNNTQRKKQKKQTIDILDNRVSVLKPKTHKTHRLDTPESVYAGFGASVGGGGDLRRTEQPESAFFINLHNPLPHETSTKQRRRPRTHYRRPSPIP